ncbi:MULTISPECIES: 3'-5' exonuclease [unclassified Microbacterium]|uniref:3'-5' exonuclease n=1 Tax=unclassified Microbacterium TaxID=2609290 RepID=UPI001DD712E7|nr:MULTISPECIES: 3'-5' exonuclease [unclassified Microbacterium]CAH0179922.1 DNA polymerase III PolC-type [Microbacterium sp. Bi121]HWK77549.1 3'-5' exonuclease [Microbacterium sp.]
MAIDQELPNWLGRIGVFDLETTGVDVTADRIVTAHVGVLDAKGREIAARSWIADPGVPIPDGAAAVHGISTEHARAHGRPAREVVTEIAGSLRALFDQGLPVVAYNASYDFSLLTNECLRHGIPPLEAPGPIIDPLVIDKAFDRYRKGKRTLEVVAEHYGVSLDGAHEASADAIAAGRVAQAIARSFPLAETAQELHTRQIGWARTQAESLTEYFVRIGRIEPEEALDGTWPVRGRAPQHEA